MVATNEKEAILKILAGDQLAFSVLMNKHVDMVYSLSLKILKDTGLAEEVTQDTFLKVYDKLATYRGEASLKSWIYRIAYHTALNKIRKKKIEFSEERNYVFEKKEVVLNDAFYNIKKEEQKQFLEIAIQKLQDQERLIIQLFYLEELSHKEICEILDISVNLIKTRLHRARKKLYFELNQVLSIELKSLL